MHKIKGNGSYKFSEIKKSKDSRLMQLTSVKFLFYKSLFVLFTVLMTFTIVKAEVQITQEIEKATFYYKLGKLVNAPKNSFDKALQILDAIDDKLNQNQKKEFSETKKERYETETSKLRRNILYHQKNYLNSFKSTFPVIELIGPSIFVNSSFLLPYDVFYTQKERKALIDGLKKLDTWILSEKKFLNKKVHVFLFPINEKTSLEDETLSFFENRKKFQVYGKQGVLSLFKSLAIDYNEFEKWEKDYYNEFLDNDFIERFSASKNNVVIATLNLSEKSLEKNFQLYGINLNFFGTNLEEIGFIGFVNSKTDEFIYALILHLLFFAVSATLFLSIKTNKKSFGLNLSANMILASSFFISGRILPWVFIPTISNIKPKLEEHVLFSFWWIILLAIVLFVIPIVFFKVINTRMVTFMPTLNIENKFGLISSSLVLGILSYLSFPLFLYHGLDALFILIPTSIAFLLNAFLLGQALDLKKSLSVEISILPLFNMSILGASIFTNEINIIWILSGISSLLAVLVFVLTREKDVITDALKTKNAYNTTETNLSTLTLDSLRDKINFPKFQRVKGFEKKYSELDVFLSGNTKFLVVTGEEGIGKSSLSEDIISYSVKKMGDKPLIILKGSCEKSPLGSPIPFLPIQDALGKYLGTDLTGAGKNNKIDTVVDSAYSMLIGPLGMFFGNSDTNEQVSEVTEKDLFDFIEVKLKTLSQKYPIILLLEDFQWADDSSLKLINHLVKKIPSWKKSSFLFLLTTSDKNKLKYNCPNVQENDIFKIERLFDENQKMFINGCFTSSSQLTSWILDWLDNDKKNGIIPRDIIDTMNLLYQNNYLTIESNLVDLTDYNPKIPNNDLEEIQALFAKSDEKRKLLTIAACVGKEFEISVLAAVLKTSQLELLSRLRELEKETGIIYDKLEKDTIFSFRSTRILEAIRIEAQISFVGPSVSSVPQFIRFIHGEIGLALKSLNKNSFMLLQRIALHFYSAGLSFSDDAVETNVRAARSSRNLLEFTQSKENLAMAKEYISFATNKDIFEVEELLLEEFMLHIKGDKTRIPLAKVLLTKYLENPCLLGPATSRICYETALNESRTEDRSYWFKKCEEVANTLKNVSCSNHVNAEVMQFLALSTDPGDRGKRVKLLKDALQICTEDKGNLDLHLVAKIKNSLAEELTYMEEIEEAKKLFNESIEIKEDNTVTDRKGLAYSYGGLGRLYFFKINDYKQAVIYFEKNKELSMELNDQLGVSKMRSFIGQSLHKLKKLKAAKKELIKCVDMQNNHFDVFASLISLLNIYIEERDEQYFASTSKKLFEKAKTDELPIFLKENLAKVLVDNNLDSANFSSDWVHRLKTLIK